MPDVVGKDSANMQREATFDGLQRALLEGKKEIPEDYKSAFYIVKTAVDFFDEGRGFDLDIEVEADRNKWHALMNPISDLVGIHRRGDVMNLVRDWKKKQQPAVEEE